MVNLLFPITYMYVCYSTYDGFYYRTTGSTEEHITLSDRGVSDSAARLSPLTTPVVMTTTGTGIQLPTTTQTQDHDDRPIRTAIAARHRGVARSTRHTTRTAVTLAADVLSPLHSHNPTPDSQPDVDP